MEEEGASEVGQSRGRRMETFIRRIFISFVANTIIAIEPVVRIIHRFDRLGSFCIVGPNLRIAPIRLFRVVVETNARRCLG
jgi:hypothetical protein